MENQEKMMTGEESLKIITEMINKTKGNMRQNVFHLIFWGWLILGCSISEYLLIKLTGYAHPYYVWFFVIPGAFVSGFIIKFKPLVIGGLSFWIIALLIHFAGPSISPLGTPVAMITGYLIPGYMLKNKVDNDKV